VQVWEGILLGLVQGLTEFLPVSSSGHLVIVQYVLGVKQPGVVFEVLVHLGTVLSVIWVFWEDLFRLATGFGKDREQRKFLALLAVTLVPTGLMGVLFSSFFKRAFESVLVVGIMLLVTGGLLRLIQRFPPGRKDIKRMRVWDAVLISAAQGAAIMPGLSRSGSTITAALARGLSIETAVRFSFLMSLPAILGATLMEARGILAGGAESIPLLPYAAATAAAFLAGVIAIKTFILMLKARKFAYFSYYTWFLGSLVILMSLLNYFD
jgi:undecaprenyl-diphosphatase